MIGPVLLSGVYVRLAAVLLLGYGVPLDWPHLRYPAWSLLLAVGMAAETALVVAWWLRRGPVAWPLVVDLPAGVGAIVASGMLTAGNDTWTGYVFWTGYAFPYTVVVAITFGLVYRTLVPALLCGVVWGVAQLAVAVGIDGRSLSDSAFVVLPYLLYPAVGGIGARLYRAGIAKLDAARELAARQAAEIAAARERARHAQALHDRVLQTVETLTRDRVVADAALAERLAADAVWLRRYVETGELDQGDDLSSELAAATRAVGVPVELNDAELRLADAPRLRAPVREALVEATHSALADLTAGDGSAAVVRAERHRGGVLVTILTRGPATRVDEEDLARVRDRLAEVGGQLTVEPAPYAELWVPAD
jgi:signal transduction histidine kinase